MNAAEMEKMDSAKTDCHEVSKLIESIIACLELYATDEMFNKLIIMTDKMELLIEKISDINSLLSEEIDVKEINEGLGEAIDSIQNKDYRLLMDLLKYEFLEKLNEWQTIIADSCSNI